MKKTTNLLLFTPEMGKRLIARSVMQIDEIAAALKDNTVVVVAGTTNGYVAEEALGRIGQGDGFLREHFYRGVTLPPGRNTASGRQPDHESAFPGDVVIEKGRWLKGRTIFDVADGLGPGDIVVKGANALDLEHNKAGILIGDPRAGTIGVALQAVYGRRVALYLPVGLEKRISSGIEDAAKALLGPGATGPRLMPVSGTAITELTAIGLLTGCEAMLAAAGGVCGAEGSVWIAASGSEQQIARLQAVYRTLSEG